MNDPTRVLNDVIGIVVLSVPIILLTMWLLPAPYSHAIYGSWAVIAASIIGIGVLEEREAERTRPDPQCSCPCVCGAADDDAGDDGDGNRKKEEKLSEHSELGSGHDVLWPPSEERDDDRGGRE